MITNGFNGKISQIAKNSYFHRTSIGRFISSSSWNEDFLINSMKKNILKTMIQRSKLSDKPIYFIIDDTISKKTNPSSKAENPIENCNFTFSHLESKKFMVIKLL